MSLSVCLWADTLGYPQGGGHTWVFLNWALGLRALGCRVVWLEAADTRRSVSEVRALAAALKDRLEPYDLASSLALCPSTTQPLPRLEGYLDFDDAAQADLLLNLSYQGSEIALSMG